MAKSTTLSLMGIAASAVLIAGCASHQSEQALEQYIASDPHAARLAQADATLIVDCLLPGKIKKMGSSFTYLTPRRPVKTSSQDCEIRGGEYVAYDRSNYQTALQVWLPLAQEGDPVAQTYVASIYEKGLGIEPDYKQALHWYQKAADQNYTRAQYALGYLYETGLGTQKNLNESFKWYRQAAGLDEQDIRIAHVELAEKDRKALQKKREAEQALLDKVVDEIDAKKVQLASLDQRLSSERLRLNKTQQQLQKTRDEQLALNQNMSRERNQWQLEVERLNEQLREKKQALAQSERQLQNFDQNAGGELSQLRQTLASVFDEKAALLSSIAALQQQAEPSDEIAHKQHQLAELNAVIERQRAIASQGGEQLLVLMNQVAAQKAALKREQSSLNLAQSKLQAEQRASDQAYAKQLTELEKQQKIIAQLEKQKSQNQQKLIYLNQVKNNDKLALLSPSIEVLEPPVPLVRSTAMATPVLKIRDGIRQREVVGKVFSDQGLMLVSMNDQSLDINSQGVFKGIVDVPKAGTLVDIVAVDTQGQRSQLKFVLSPDSTKYRQTGAGEETQSTKPSFDDVEFGDYYALLIGNNNYRHLPKLLTPIKDVEVTAQLLKSKYGFKETIILENATRYDIITQLNALRKKLTDKDNLVIYYAGHGEIDRVNMRGQWLPVDAEPENTANWISNSSLTELINAINAKHVLVVADSCYSGLLTRTALTHTEGNRSEEARKTWLQKMTQKRARLVLTSGGIAPVLDEGGGDHSIFARAFIDILDNNQDVLEGQKLFRQVSAMVSVAADKYRVEQVPEYAPIRHAGHESGDFLLVPTL